MRKFYFISAIIIMLPWIALSQEYTEIFENTWGMGENFSTPTFCDIDHDGLLEMIVGNQDGRLSHYQQNAVGSIDFTLVTQFFNEIDVGEFSTPYFVDLDNDGLLDMMVGGQFGTIRHFEQEAVNSLNFSLITTEFNGIDIGYGSAPYFTDLDNDALLDMIVAERVGNLNYYEQDAVDSEIFTLVDDTLSGIVAQWRPRPFFLDLDNDGLLDLIIGGGNGELSHYEQNDPGSINFNLISEKFSDIDVGAYSAPWFVDLNEDGILDLIIGEESGYINHFTQIEVNSNSFLHITEKFLNGIIDVGLYAAPALADLDEDGLLDMIVGTEEGTLYHYEQDAVSSSFFTFISNSFNSIDVGNVAVPILTDLNNNNLYDLIIGEQVGNLNYYEQESPGSTTFQLVTDDLGAINVGNYSAPSVADLDGDGLLDLVVGENEGHLRHYEQITVGSTDFTWISDSLGSINVGNLSSPCFTDLDSDGLLDLIVGCRGSNVYHYEQDSPGSSEFNYNSEYFNDVFISGARPVFVEVNGDNLDDYLVGTYLGDVRYFQRIDDTFVEHQNVTSFPQSFTLFQNYPNPFNPSTTIAYAISQESFVTIKIYDILGKEIKTIVNKKQSVGEYKIQFDGSQIASGIYFCHMRAGDFAEMRKLVLLR